MGRQDKHPVVFRTKKGPLFGKYSLSIRNLTHSLLEAVMTRKIAFVFIFASFSVFFCDITLAGSDSAGSEQPTTDAAAQANNPLANLEAAPILDLPRSGCTTLRMTDTAFPSAWG